jgi:hypothetical protein
VGDTLVPVDLTVPVGGDTPVSLTFTTDTPGVKEPTGASPRMLAFELYDWSVIPESP